MRVASGGIWHILITGAARKPLGGDFLMGRFHAILGSTALLVLLSAGAIRGWTGGERPVVRRDPVLTGNPTPGWLDFASFEGVGWEARFEEEKQLVHRAYGPPVDLGCGPLLDAGRVEDACLSFIRDRPSLFGAGEDELRLARAQRMGRVWHVCFNQLNGDCPVLGGRIMMRVSDDGMLFMFGDESFSDVGSIAPPVITVDEARSTAIRAVGFDEGSDQDVGCRLVVLPVYDGTRTGFELCWEVRLRTRYPLGNWFVYIHAYNGSLTSLENRLWSQAVYGTVSGEVLPQFHDDNPVVEPFPSETVRIISGDSASTNRRGNYSVSVDSAGTYTLISRLYGDYVRVLNDDGPDAVYVGNTSTFLPHRWTWQFQEDGLEEEMNAYYHINRIHDWIKGPPYNFSQVDYRMNVTVRWGNGVNGAFFDGWDMYLGEGDTLPSGMRSLALFSDVIYHEYTHAITDRIYSVSGGMQFYAMMEGFSDYVTATLNDNPLIGDGGLYRIRPYIRTVYNDLRYPEDFGISSHHDGQIVGGALWDLRTSEGAGLTDSLWFYAIQGEPLTFEDLLIEVLLADDDNVNLSDGTPHGCSIYQAFGGHGIGPGTGISIDHTPHKDTEETEEPYLISASVHSAGRTPPTRLYYKGRRDKDYMGIWMTREDTAGLYVGEIPPQPHGTLVKYYFESRCVRLPAGAPDWDAFSFYVGLDTIPPEISHRSLPDHSLEGFPVEVSAEITDNLALIEPPSLDYTINGGTERSLDMARLGNSDTYYADIDTGVSPGDFVQYRIVARDSSAAGNTAFAPGAGLYYGFQVCEGFFDDMESGPDGWVQSTTPGYTDEWRLTGRRHCEVIDSTSWGCGQDSGDYSNYNHSILETPILNVDFDARLIFYHRMDAETLDFYRCGDGGIVEVSRDSGSTWERVVPNGGYPFLLIDTGASPIPPGRCYSGSFDWRWAEINLAAYYGDIKIRFRFGSNEMLTAEGWYVDNVQVINCRPPGVGEGLRRLAEEIQFDLKRVYPNPARAAAVLKYAVPADAHVRLEVYNLSGQLVRRLADGLEERGRKSFVWDGRDDRGAEVPSGLYFVTLRVGEWRAARKLEILR